jgi:hypothetical protein
MSATGCRCLQDDRRTVAEIITHRHRRVWRFVLLNTYAADLQATEISMHFTYRAISLSVCRNRFHAAVAGPAE